MERRKALSLLVHGGSATAALVVGIPTLMYAVTPTSRQPSGPLWRDLGPLDSFPIGAYRAAKIQHSLASQAAQAVLSGVYVWRINEQTLVVFSRSCTDLGCPVTFDRRSECFLCPCHGGIFDKHGQRMAGPPDRPPYRYDVRVVDGILQVDLASVPPMV